MKIILFLLALLFSSSAFAKDWKIDKENSKIEFFGTHAGNNFSGEFTNLEGKIEFDSNNLARSFAKIKIDLKSAKTGNQTYDKTIPQDDWLDTKNYPAAFYETIKISKIAGDKYKIEGVLNIRNIKMRHDFEANIKIDGNLAVVNATTEIKRLNFNIGKSSDSSGTWVSLNIPLTIKLKAVLK